MRKDIPDPDQTHPQEVIDSRNETTDEPSLRSTKMTAGEKEAALATKVWIVERLAWAAQGKGAGAQHKRFLVVLAVLSDKSSVVEILEELKGKGVAVESGRYHLNDYLYTFRSKRK